METSISETFTFSNRKSSGYFSSYSSECGQLKIKTCEYLSARFVVTPRKVKHKSESELSMLIVQMATRYRCCSKSSSIKYSENQTWKSHPISKTNESSSENLLSHQKRWSLFKTSKSLRERLKCLMMGKKNRREKLPPSQFDVKRGPGTTRQTDIKRRKQKQLTNFQSKDHF